MLGFLTLGLLIGMTHAFEADHLAAMSGIATEKQRGARHLFLRGCAWGLGHTITLFLISGAVLVLGAQVTETRSAQLEFGVGVMLVGLGIHVLWQFWRSKTHFHVHRHDGDPPHFHAHSHDSLNDHKTDPHEHLHGLSKPLFVGLVHGMAGSAGLLALAAGTQSVCVAMSYVLIFGIGSMIGMGLLSLVVYWPLTLAERSTTYLHNGLVVAAGLAAIAIGALVLMETAPLAWGVSLA